MQQPETGARFVPRYFEIEQALRGRIAKLDVDAPLPSDAMLCEEFGVSRMTARNAVQRLAQEGIVYRVPGRGTFVARPPAHRQASSLVSFTEEMLRQGRTPSSQVLERGLREPVEGERAGLRLPAGACVVVLRRVRLADEAPMAVETAVFPEAVASVILGSDLERRSLHAALVEAGIVPTEGRATITAEPASSEDARVLVLRRGEPLLVERRLILDAGGVPLELTESRYAGGRYALDVRFDVEAARRVKRRPGRRSAGG